MASSLAEPTTDGRARLWAWRLWPQRGLARHALLLALACALVKAAGLAREFLVAGIYGRSDALEAFLTAALLPALLVNLIAEATNQALIPVYIRVRMRQGAQAAQQLFAGACGGSLLLLVLASLALAWAAPLLVPWIASNYAAEKQALTRQLFYALLPLATVTGVASNCAALLNASDRYLLAALAPLAISLSVALGAPLLAPGMGVWALVVTTAAGTLLYALILGAAAYGAGGRLALPSAASGPALRETAGQFGPVFLSSVVASGGLIADQMMAAMLPPGSVASLLYANRFVSVLLALLAGPLSTVLTPHFARLAATGEWWLLAAAIRRWATVALLLSSAAAVALMAGAPVLVRLAYQHGAFGAQDTAVVAFTLLLYALQIPFFVTSRVYYRFLLARGRSELILACGAINLALDILLNWLLMRPLGVAGLALSTSLWSLATLLFLWRCTVKILREDAAQA